MKISIIVDDKSVYKDKKSFEISDTSYIPENVHALQFDEDANIGHIEYKNIPNEIITSLPEWAIVALQNYDNEILAYEEQQRILFENAKKGTIND